MTHWLHHSLVLASDHRATHPERVGPLLRRRQAALAEIGAHHVLVYTSITDPERVLVVIAVHAREPLLDILHSRAVFEWFDAVGVDDIPAVFAGELVEALTVDPADPVTVPEVVVSMVTPVDDLAGLREHVLASGADLRAAGVRRLSAFSAFDDPLEVMLLLQIHDEAHAHHWLRYSDLAAEWLTKAGVGAYPPVFVGRLHSLVRVDPRRR
ncbi:fatty-acid--CoA ligase [Mycobacterium yunnanensis]|uniref:Fatty-acid--CoA ligase n=1 Tax=Mycobacterium yunnanensis TaxID=368477 RepID=A0A9X2YZ30_9MYCO|nr:fatty-acid--CoA ligase [Mycobacterium yunnanensis]MCV7420210.1 fatty-acid--CoA ligase [Mycobacterium yunnanensis]